MTPSSDAKSVLRQQLKLVLRGVDATSRGQRSQAAASRLLQCPEYRQARTIMLFVSMSSEIDTTLIAEDAWATGRRVLVPRARMEDRSMQAVIIGNFAEAAQRTAIGVQEPTAGNVVDPAEIDLVIVPGLGFGPQGQRIGRGAGFYDRFLANPALRAVRCGYGYETQVIDGIPMTEHDTPLDMLVTDETVRRFRS